MKVFVAAPFTQMLDPTTKVVEPTFRTWLESLIGVIAKAGHEPISAHVREDWGASLDSPSVALKTDIEDLRQSDVVVAEVGSPPSPGVQYELGAATILGIPFVLLVDAAQPTPYLNPGISDHHPTEVIELEPREKALEQIVPALNRAARRDIASEPS
jgi:hypothetical protein